MTHKFTNFSEFISLLTTDKRENISIDNYYMVWLLLLLIVERTGRQESDARIHI